MLFIAADAELADTLDKCQLRTYSRLTSCDQEKYLLEVLADWFGGICTISTICAIRYVVCTVFTVEFGHSRRRSRACRWLAVK